MAWGELRESRESSGCLSLHVSEGIASARDVFAGIGMALDQACSWNPSEEREALSGSSQCQVIYIIHLILIQSSACTRSALLFGPWWQWPWSGED